jgi:hypothetical protein
MLVRMIDDFLLVTTDRLKASRFLRSMHAGSFYFCPFSF